MRLIKMSGFVFAALAWSWLAVRYFSKGDTVGGIIFLVTAIISVVLFLSTVVGKKQA